MTDAERDAAVVTEFLAARAARDGAAVADLAAPDFEEVLPQTGERVEGLEAAAELARRDPEPPRPAGELHLTRLSDDQLLVEVAVERPGPPAWLVALAHVHRGRLHRLRTYIGEPFEIPAWRAHLVATYDPSDPAEWATVGDGRPVSRTTIESFAARLVGDDQDAVAAFFHADFRTDYPQSGERHDVASEAAIDRSYPGGLPRRQVLQMAGAADRWVMTPANTPLRVSGAADIWAVEGLFSYGPDDPWFMVAVTVFRDGRIWRERDYWAQRREPPAWRAGLASPAT